MIWLAKTRILKWLGGFTTTFWLVIVGVLAALLVVQTVRIEGFKLWPLSIEGWKPKAERLSDDLAAIERVQAKAAKDAHAARLAAEARYRTLAENADAQIANARDAALSAADRFIADNRMRPPADRCPGGDTGARAGGGGAGVPAPVPTDPFVAVREPDVRICSQAAAYAVAAHNWAAMLPSSRNR